MAKRLFPLLFSLVLLLGCASQQSPPLSTGMEAVVSVPETVDAVCPTAARYTRENPDYEGLARCSLYAKDLGEHFGIEILIYKEAAAMAPWDYEFEYEYRPDVLQQELELLEQRLGNYPESMLQKLERSFSSLKICMVRSISGSDESGSVSAAGGVQFRQDSAACIALASTQDTEYALYHELYHLMETVVLSSSTAWDHWEELSPAEFQYDNDYIQNRNRDGSAWLQPGKEAFIDTYSMSYPKEDRARLMEFAMTPGHEALFRSPYLQAKLLQLCIGIREGFGLEQSQEAFLWEQYLNTPLACK